MQLALLDGRLFQPGERDVIVLSRSAARAAFDGDDPLGRVWNPDGGSGGPVVVGIVEPSTLAALRDPRSVETYVPLTEEALAGASVIARTNGDGRAVLGRARDAAAGPRRTPSAWVVQTPVDQLLQHSLAATRMIGALGTAASALAALGLFGLMAFSVRERTRELAIRIALGARARATAVMLLTQYAKPLAIGMAVGTMLAVAGAQMLLGLQLGLGLDTRDPGGYLLGLSVFALIALAAVLVPLRRAVRTDPAIALRSE